MSTGDTQNKAVRRHLARRQGRSRLIGAAVVAGGLLVLAGASVAATAKHTPGEIQAVALPGVSPKHFKGDVRKAKNVPPKKRGNFEPSLPASKKSPSGPVQAGPSAPAGPNMPSAAQNFAGLAFAGTCSGTLCGAGWPPDPVGDVGPNHYVEAVNTSIGIFSKTGTQLAAFTFDALWSGAGTGTPCDDSNFGDVTVLYDHLSDHWIVSDLGFHLDATGTNPVAPFYECIAVSKTGDPVNGGWYLYAVRMDPGAPGTPPSGYLNDYPKMGLWPDGLFVTANEFDMNVPSQPFKGVALWAFDRVAMEAGQPLKSLVAFSNNGTDPVSVLPANLRGASPPAGTPEYLVSESALAYAFEVRTYTVNWTTTPASGVVSGPTNASQAQYVVGAGAIVPQPPDPFDFTSELDAIDDRPMMQAQYRNLGGTESLWVAHAVRTSSTSPTGIQWAQLNVTGKTIATTPVQQQIFTNGDDGLWRWIPSLAVDSSGDMAVGYSASSASVYPSIRYAGRLASDPPNTLPQAEAVLQAGAGSQTVSDRWGDYSAMSVDPTDGCTFWYVNEYYAGPYDGSLFYAQWSTQIGSFKFPSCGSAPTTGTLNGTVTDASATPLNGATVTLSNGASTATNASGFYQFGSVPAGTYGVSAAKTGYTTGTASGVVVTAGSTTTQNFALTPSPPGTLQGTVTDASTQLAVNGATVTLSTGATATTNPSGVYQFASIAAGTYSVTAAKAGYTSNTASGVVVTSGGTTTQDFALTAPAPTITGFTPNRGKVGTVVTITGTNLLTARAVVFNTTAATEVTVISATKITARVPAGATTGKIKVTTSGGPATSSGTFRVR